MAAQAGTRSLIDAVFPVDWRAVLNNWDAVILVDGGAALNNWDLPPLVPFVLPTTGFAHVSAPHHLELAKSKTTP